MTYNVSYTIIYNIHETIENSSESHELNFLGKAAAFSSGVFIGDSVMGIATGHDVLGQVITGLPDKYFIPYTLPRDIVFGMAAVAMSEILEKTGVYKKIGI